MKIRVSAEHAANFDVVLDPTSLVKDQEVIRSFHSSAFPPAALARAKRTRDLTVSVCIPAHNEEGTVGSVVSKIKENLVEKHLVVDEIVVLDDRSSDRTSEVAAAAGARVVRTERVLARAPGSPGKGKTLWKSLYVSSGDIVCWIDADIEPFRPEMVTGLVGPLLMMAEVGLVKGFFTRPNVGESGGGRVTELVAKPLIASLFPDLAGVHQPLAGATAARRQMLEGLPLQSGWGVEFALLLDVAAIWGRDVIAQTDLGILRHRNKPLEKLIPQASAIVDIAITHSGISQASIPLFGGVLDGTQASTHGCSVLPPMGQFRFGRKSRVRESV